MDEPTYVAVPILTGGPLAFVPDTHLCLACSKHTCNGEKYYIVRKGGELGPSNQCASAFFEVSFFGQENEGAYLCRECKRSIDSALKWQEKANKVFSEIDKTSQKLLTAISKRQSSPKLSTTKKLKKNMESGDGECSNIAFLDQNKKPGDQMIISNILELDQSSSTQLPSTGLPDKRLALFQPEFIQPLMESNIVRTDVKTINRSCQTSPALYHTQTRGSRTEAVHYLNLSWKSLLNDIVKLICNGNIKKAVKHLLLHQNKDIRQKTIDSVIAVIKEEAIGYAKKPETHIRTTINDIESFDLKTLAHELKTQNPVLWSLMSAASANGPNVKSENRVVTAMSIIFKNRLPTMNALQRNLGIILYNNHLQKDAFHILSKIGITTSYSTMNKDLHRIKNFADQAVQRMKKSLEENGCQNTAEQNDHSYTKLENNTPTSMNDHSYSKNTPECADKPHDNLSPAYRFNLDNLDFHLKVRDMTQDHQNMLKHYVQLMAVKDRVNCEHLPDNSQIGNLVDVANNEFLPNADDISGLREDIINLTATLLVNHLKCFKVFEGTIVQHPQHTFSKEMKEKSCVVPLGILPLNENKTSEMIDVLKYLHKFVPGHREEEEIMNEEIRDDTSAGMRTIPCGGDQLSVERLRSAHSARFDGDTPEERLEGVIAMVEDFHEKMNFLQVIMDKFYATSSAREQGTLYQLRNVINRRNVVKTVSQDYHADSSFIDLVTDCHVITAAMEHFNLEEVNSTSDRIPADIETADVPTKKRLLLHLAAEVVDKYFLNSLNESIVRIEDRDDKDRQNDDKILNYATNLTKLGLLRKLSVMATRYGDGLRAMRHWKYAFLVYHQSKKTKYRLESFLLLAGINALFTPRQRHQIVFNRFVNLKGGEGNNLDGDYVMELLNRYAKSRVKLLGPNQSSEVINRIGKTMMTCHNIQEKLENSLNVSLSSGFHKKQDLERDRASIIKHLKEGKVFSNILGRCHHSFQKEKSDLFGDIDIKEFHAYIHDKKKLYSNKKLAF